MKILVACEFSGVVSQAFRERGHEVYSCDIIPSEHGEKYHFQCDVREILHLSWDMMIAFPPCQHLCVSGARWFKDKIPAQNQALNFVQTLLDAKIPKIALENPIGIISTQIRKPDQIIQPYQFGHGETKATCLWLKNLPKLYPTDMVQGRESRIHKMPPSPTRSKDRSRTYTGIARAMAEQWK